MANIVISKAKRSVVINNAPTSPLSVKTFDLLYYLTLNHDKFNSREKIIADIWDTPHVSPRTIDVHVSRLNKLFGKTKDGEPSILSKIKIGYKLNIEIQTDDDLSTDNAIDLQHGIKMGTYKDTNKNITVVMFIAESKYGDMVIHMSGGKAHASPIKDFTTSFRFMR